MFPPPVGNVSPSRGDAERLSQHRELRRLYAMPFSSNPVHSREAGYSDGPVGSLAQTHRFPTALSITALALIFAAVTWIWIPETKGAVLE